MRQIIRRSVGMSDERLEKIETKIAFLEDAMEELNRALYGQQKQIDQLQAMVESLVSHVRDMSDQIGERLPANERPPHY